MRPLHTLLVVLVFAAACDRAAATETAKTASAGPDKPKSRPPRLNDWLDARYEEELAFSPVEKTRSAQGRPRQDRRSFGSRAQAQLD